MTIASEITRIKDNIANTYTALGEKGATLPELQNSDNLAGTVATVVTGGGAEAPTDYIDHFNEEFHNLGIKELKAIPDDSIINQGFNSIFSGYLESNRWVAYSSTDAKAEFIALTVTSEISEVYIKCEGLYGYKSMDPSDTITFSNDRVHVVFSNENRTVLLAYKLEGGVRKGSAQLQNLNQGYSTFIKAAFFRLPYIGCNGYENDGYIHRLPSDSYSGFFPFVTDANSGAACKILVDFDKVHPSSKKVYLSACYATSNFSSSSPSLNIYPSSSSDSLPVLLREWILCCLPIERLSEVVYEQVDEDGYIVLPSTVTSVQGTELNVREAWATQFGSTSYSSDAVNVIFQIGALKINKVPFIIDVGSFGSSSWKPFYSGDLRSAGIGVTQAKIKVGSGVNKMSLAYLPNLSLESWQYLAENTAQAETSSTIVPGYSALHKMNNIPAWQEVKRALEGKGWTVSYSW